MNIQEIIVYAILAFVACIIIYNVYRYLTGKSKGCDCSKHCSKTGCKGCHCPID